MNAKERVLAAINHKQPDRVPVDLGSTSVTGINASTLYKLRKALNLCEKEIHIQQLTQMLGVVDEDVRQKLGVDVIGLFNPSSFSGGDGGPTQPFVMSDGTPVRIQANIAWDRIRDGGCVIYPQGDPSAKPSLYMPTDGFFFDALDRAEPFDEDALSPVEDFQNTFFRVGDKEAEYYARRSKELAESGDYAIIGALNCGSLGDVALLPGRDEKEPRGIRRMDDWLAAHILYPDYIKAVFRYQTDIALQNLRLYREAVGNRIQIIQVSGTDFGTQNGPMFRLELFRELYKPFYREINDWIHRHTEWKTFFHCCGGIADFIEDFIEMGVDILNPVQLSAAGMDAAKLKQRFGGRIVFWGGGVDTQKTLPFGTTEEVRDEVLARLAILSGGGGYVFNGIHNIQAKTPVENLIAVFDAVREFNGV